MIQQDCSIDYDESGGDSNGLLIHIRQLAYSTDATSFHSSSCHSVRSSNLTNNPRQSRNPPFLITSKDNIL